MDIDHIKYTIKHKIYFLKVEKTLLNKNTMRGYFHDVDKLFLYLFQKHGDKWVSRWHRRYSKHHPENAKTKVDYIQMIIDWESSRYTKSDKPLNARQTLYQIYPKLIKVLEPILKDLNL